MREERQDSVAKSFLLPIAKKIERKRFGDAADLLLFLIRCFEFEKTIFAFAANRLDALSYQDNTRLATELVKRLEFSRKFIAKLKKHDQSEKLDRFADFFSNYLTTYVEGLLAKGRLVEAAKYTESTLGSRLYDVYLLETAGYLYHKNRMYRESETCYRLLSDLRPDNRSFRYNLANVLMERDRAFEAMKVAYDLFTSLPDVNFSMTPLHAIPKEKLTAYDKTLEPLNVANVTQRQAISWSIKSGDINQDIDKMKHSVFDNIESKPRHLIYRNKLGKVFRPTGKDEKDELILHALNVVLPSNPSIFNNLGVVYFKKGDFIKSREYLFRSARLMRRSPAILNNLAVLNAKMGTKEAALDYIQDALRIDKNDPIIKQNLDNIISDNKEALIPIYL
jgi:tetratricopeptide (TPR) repeat protein